VFWKNLLAFDLFKAWQLLLLPCGLKLNVLKLHPQSALKRFVRLSENTSIVSQYSVDLMVFPLKRSVFAARCELNLELNLD
jgi:hypothetical protein